jgi:hypothetical protein
MLIHVLLTYHIEKWNELLPALIEASESPNAEHREAALRIFSAVPNLLTDLPINEVKQVFLVNLQDANNAAVCIKYMFILLRLQHIVPSLLIACHLFLSLS